MKPQEKIESMLRHLSVGDALGKICSKYTKQEILSIYGAPITELVEPIRRKSIRNWEKGSITDDTILTLLVSDSLIYCKGFDRRDIASRFIECDPKGGTQIELLKQSNNLNYIAESGLTNGAAIRVSPLVVVYPNLRDLTQKIINLSTLTHGTPEAITGALLVAYSLNYFLEEKECKPEEFIVDTIKNYYSESLQTKTLLKLQEGFIMAKNSESYELCDKLEESLGYSKYAWSSIPTAIILGIASKDNYSCLLDIIHRNNPMGDLDTVSSIAGSILGLRRKDPKIEQMSNIIEEVNQINFLDYANKLLDLRYSKND